jgi:hypothetical protein
MHYFASYLTQGPALFLMDRGRKEWAAIAKSGADAMALELK